MGDRMDTSKLFLQLCLVLGAVCLVLQRKKLREFFFKLTLVVGTVGTGLVYGLIH